MAEGSEPLLDRFTLEGRTLQVRFGLVELRPGKRAVGVEMPCPLGGRAEQVLVRRRSVQVIGERCDVLAPAPCLEQGEVCLRGVGVLPARIDGQPLDRVVQRGHRLGTGDPVATANRDTLDASRDLERDDVLVVLDETLVAGGYGRGPSAPRQEQEREHGPAPQPVLDHASDNKARQRHRQGRPMPVLTTRAFIARFVQEFVAHKT